MTKLLDHWGIADELRTQGIAVSAIAFRDGPFSSFLHPIRVTDVFGSRPTGDTAEMIGTQKLIAPVMKQFGADFLAYQVCSILRCASSTTIPD
jgi:hypothetical protein